MHAKGWGDMELRKFLECTCVDEKYDSWRSRRKDCEKCVDVCEEVTGVKSDKNYRAARALEAVYPCYHLVEHFTSYEHKHTFTD